MSDFLRTVITAESGWFCLCVRSGAVWLEEWFRWPENLPEIEARARQACRQSDVYFSTYLFKDRRSTKENVLWGTRTIQADLDEADISTLPIEPTVLVRTSSSVDQMGRVTDRHQGYWVLREPVDLEIHELLSRKVSFSINQCDKSGWPLGRKVRLPGTLNHKYIGDPQPVEVMSVSRVTYDPQDVELLPDAPEILANKYDEGFIDGPPTELGTNPLELLESFRTKIPPRVYAGYNIQQRDRSAYLWLLTNSLFRGGASKEEVFWIAKHSSNNKFDKLKYNADRELAKDVLRAEASASGTEDPQAMIMQARKAQLTQAERKQFILMLVRKRMQQEGVFIRTTDEYGWYIRRDLGRPIMISPKSEKLRSLLDLEFGLNATEVETAYVMHGLTSFITTVAPTYENGALSYFDKAGKMVVLHTGRKDVLRVTAEGMEKSNNGSYGVIFPWQPNIEPFLPQAGMDDWGSFVFGKSVGNVVNMPPDEAMAILKSWVLFILLRSASPTRPILALVGQPGSGKSYLLKAMYSILYGRKKDLGSLTKPENFDQAMLTMPFAAIDNADTWMEWLPDRLALSAGLSDIEKRKLYSDADTIILKRQALVGLSSHDPRFWRPDVADRLLLLIFRRIDDQSRLPENMLLDNLSRERNKIWGSIIDNLIAVMKSPLPEPREVPYFRIADFAHLGFWCARALGFGDSFRKALTRVSSSQKMTSLEEDQLLVSAIRKMVDKSGTNGEYRPIVAVWQDLVIHSTDQEAFVRTYKNAVRLHHKLWVLQDSLRQLFDVDWKEDPMRGSRVWKLCGREL